MTSTFSIRKLIGATLPALTAACAAPGPAVEPAARGAGAPAARVDPGTFGAEHAASRASTSPPSPAALAPSVKPSGCGTENGTAPRRVFTKIFEAPVRALAAGKPLKVAVVSGDAASLFDGERWQKIAPAFPEGSDAYEIFFGRDNQPRLMGYTGRPGSSEPLRSHYRRHRDLRWIEADAELGPLGGRNGGLYGVLGYEDPEVVCKPKVGCLIKRLSGWTRTPAHELPVRIVVSGDSGWALHRDRIERVEGTRWIELTPPRAWNDPRALWAGARGEIWVIEAAGAVLRYSDGQWTEMQPPLARPLDVWGSSPSDVWLTGHDGAAHFDGAAFRCVPGVKGPLHVIRHADGHLWLAGQSGVWHAPP